MKSKSIYVLACTVVLAVVACGLFVWPTLYTHGNLGSKHPNRQHDTPTRTHRFTGEVEYRMMGEWSKEAPYQSVMPEDR